MDSEKLGSSSESSSDEQSDPIKEDYSDSLTNKRSYGCIFCKRGFTNAQALGGHMNIHRKDRANKAKQVPSFSYSLLSKQIDQPTLARSRPNYRASGSNPHGYFQELGELNMNLWGSDLSLQIGPSKERRPIWNGDGVDLELRLGHDP